MARIRLAARRVGQLPFFRPGDTSGVVAQIPLYRLIAKLVVVPRDASDAYRPLDLNDALCPDAIVDTGAPLTLFPYEIWEPFAAQIQWFDQPPRDDGTPRQVTILGGRFRSSLGRVKLGAIDEDARWLPPVTVNAWFLQYHAGSPKQAILGLRSRLLDRRRLRQEELRDEDAVPAWWLEDA